MEIILLRHGKPIIPSLQKIKAISFINWIKSYNDSGLCSTSIPSQTTLNRASKCNAFVCSHLLRSKQSAEALNIKKITLSESQFNEAGLPSANWGILKLSPNTWAIIFRILWLFGYAKIQNLIKKQK